MKIDYGINEVEQIAKLILDKSKTKIFLFYGNMGVGKTTLIKKIIKTLGSDDDVSSPTFSIVNEYKFNDEKIYHFDLYRINDIEEAFNFGIEDYLYSDNWIFIEWPEKIEAILDENYDKITLELDDDNNRILSLNTIEKN